MLQFSSPRHRSNPPRFLMLRKTSLAVRPCQSPRMPRRPSGRQSPRGLAAEAMQHSSSAYSQATGLRIDLALFLNSANPLHRSPHRYNDGVEDEHNVIEDMASR